MLSRCCLVKPSSEKVTEYVPTGRLVIRYCPAASVVAVRTFSMSAGLVASTITPGMTPPCPSRTTPAIWPCCAKADSGRAIRNAANTNVAFTQRGIAPPPVSGLDLPRDHNLLQSVFAAWIDGRGVAQAQGRTGHASRERGGYVGAFYAPQHKVSRKLLNDR